MSSNIPFSTKPVPTVGQLRNVNINANTLATGQVISYDSTTQLWANTAGGGGGGATITGTDEAVVWKNGVNGVATQFGISKNTTLAGYAMNIDIPNKRVGVNKATPSVPLDVVGTTKISDGVNTLTIDGDEVGLDTAPVLRLYTNNDKTDDASVRVDGAGKALLVGGTVGTNAPALFDAPNSTTQDGIYKIKLQQGMNLAVAVAPFDAQNPLSNATTSFPTGQVVEYQNNKPIQDWAIISRLANGVTITPAVAYVFSNFGSFSAFTDRMIYDPMGCRSRLAAGIQWQWAGAPSVLRVVGNEFMINVKWYVDGVFSIADPVNQLDIYITQYRNGALLRQYLVSTQGAPSQAYHTSGERTFMGMAPYGEDFNCLTDDFQAEMVNFGANSFTIGTTQTEFRFILAQ